MNSAEDRDFERYLSGDDALSRAYADLKSDRPSPALDQAVLARARDALKAGPRDSLTRRRNWTALTALAATVLLSFGLVMRLALEPDSQLPVTPVVQEARDSSAEGTAASMPADRADDAAASKKASPAPLAAPPVTSPALSAIEDQRPAIESEIRAAAEQAPSVHDPQPPAVLLPQSGYVEPPPAAKQRAARSESATAAQPMQRETANGLHSDERDLARVQKAQAPAASPAMDAASAKSAELSQESLAKEEFTRTPEAWLAEIARLRAAGETGAADQELARFKEAHPGYLQKLEPYESQSK